MEKCTYIDGIGSSQVLDTAGEVVDIKGLDCSSLKDAPFNYEHKSDLPAQIIGKILDYKKIFSEKDCDNERHLYYWKKVNAPFLYVMGRLFDDKKESSKEIAALFIDDAEHPNEKPMVGFSVEGQKINKQGMTITHSIARKMTVTVAPANKSCIAEMVPNPEKQKDDLDSIFKTECTGEVLLFKSEEDYEKIMNKPMKKDLSPAGQPSSPSGMFSSEMAKRQESWSSPSKVKDAIHFGHSQHGVVSIHKTPEGQFHVKHNGATAGLKGNKGIFNTPKEAGEHAKKYMSAVSSESTMGHQLHNRPSPSMIGKEPISSTKKSDTAAPAMMPPPIFPDKAKVAKSLTAGSGMAAPGSLTGGAALGKEELEKGDPEDHKYLGSVQPKEFKPGKKYGTKQMTYTGSNDTHHNFMHGDRAIKIKRAPSIVKSENKWLDRAKEEYSKWGKREEFENYMTKRMPHLTKGEINAIGQVLALNKAIKAEKAFKNLKKDNYDIEPMHSYFQKSKPIKKFDDAVMNAPMSNSEMKKDSDIMMASESKTK